MCCLQFSRRFNSPPGSVHGEQRKKQRRTWLSVRPSPISSLRETHVQRQQSQHQITRTCTTSLYLHRAGQWLNSTCSLNVFLKRLESEGRALSSRGLFEKVPHLRDFLCSSRNPESTSSHSHTHSLTHPFELERTAQYNQVQYFFPSTARTGTILLFFFECQLRSLQERGGKIENFIQTPLNWKFAVCTV